MQPSIYHLGYRAIEKRILPYCTKQGIAVVRYSPFRHGDFPSSKNIKGKVLEDIANLHAWIEMPRQVTLNFLSLHSNVFTIPKAHHPERVRENSESLGGWNVTDKDIYD